MELIKVGEKTYYIKNSLCRFICTHSPIIIVLTKTLQGGIHYEEKTFDRL